MEYLGTFKDDTIGADYRLFIARLSQVRDVVKSSLKKHGVDDASIFDTENEHWNSHQKEYMSDDVQKTFINNGFIYMQGEEDPWLLDGYTRVFKIDADANVFVKVYDKSLEVPKVIKLLIQLNYWKTLGNGQARANNVMVDRGFALYTYMRTGTNISQRMGDYECPIVGYRNLVSTLIVNFLNSMNPKGRTGFGSFSESISQLEYDRFFDDIKLICDLHSISFDYTGTRKAGRKRLPIKFYLLIANQRSKGNMSDLKIDVRAVEEWIKSQPELMSMASLYWEKQLSNGQESVRQDATQYFDNKYFRPVVLGEQPELTQKEKKELHRKEAAAAKKNLKPLVWSAYESLPVGTKVYKVYVQYPYPIEIKEYEWAGIDENGAFRFIGESGEFKRDRGFMINNYEKYYRKIK